MYLVLKTEYFYFFVKLENDVILVFKMAAKFNISPISPLLGHSTYPYIFMYKESVSSTYNVLYRLEVMYLN